MARMLTPAPARVQDGESSGEFRLTTPLMVLGQPVNRLQSYDGDSGEDGIDSFTAYFSSASVEQVAALAKMSDPVAGTYTKEVGPAQPGRAAVRRPDHHRLLVQPALTRPSHSAHPPAASHESPRWQG
ncbi:MAG: hypothetical protein PBU97_01695 [Stenotrophomonas maltophilia]